MLILHNAQVIIEVIFQVADMRMVGGKYYGGTAEINIYELPQVSRNQLSLSAIWVNYDDNGPRRDQVNSILAGWMVSHSAKRYDIF